jgi:uncharacterized membrane protein
MTKLVCLLVAERPCPHTLSRKDACSVCGAAVWRALSSPAEAEAEAICGGCLPQELRKEMEITLAPPTPEQLVDVLRYRSNLN